MEYAYKSQQCPSNMDSRLHESLIEKGFSLKSFSRKGNEAGYFNYEAAFAASCQITVQPKFISGARATIFIEGSYIDQVRVENLPTLDLLKAAEVFASMRLADLSHQAPLKATCAAASCAL